MKSFFDAEPDLRLADPGLVVWLTEPWGFVSFFERPGATLTEPVARFLVADVRSAVLPRRPPGARLTAIHDWRNISGYTSAARTAMVHDAKELSDEVGDTYVLIGEGVPSLVRMGVEVATTALRPFGVRVWALRQPAEVRARVPTLSHHPLR